MNLKTIPTDRIDRDPAQPRQHFDEEKMRELRDSIAEVGIQQAIKVRYNRQTRRYVLIAGERRWRAAAELGLADIPAIIEGDIAYEDAFVRSVVENVVRADMLPMEEARAYARLHDEFEWPVEQISAKFGKSASYVQWRIDLLKLTPSAADAVDKGILPVGLAWYVCRLSADHQNLVMGKWVRGEFPNYREAEAYAQRLRVIIEDQPSMFDVEQLTEEEQEKVMQTAQRVCKVTDHASKAVAALAELAQLTAEELAVVFAGSQRPAPLWVYREQVAQMRKQLSTLDGALRKAAAILDTMPQVQLATEAAPDA